MYSCKNSNNLNISGQKELNLANNISSTEKENQNIEYEQDSKKDDQIIEYINLNSEIITAKINIKKDELIESIPDIINSIEIGKKYEIKGDDYDIKIHPINESLGENTTFVNFLECESILRGKYNLSSDKILTTLQIEIQSKSSNSLTNQVEYAVYDNQKTKLDLSVCGDTKIQLNYEIINS